MKLSRTLLACLLIALLMPWHGVQAQTTNRPSTATETDLGLTITSTPASVPAGAPFSYILNVSGSTPSTTVPPSTFSNPAPVAIPQVDTMGPAAPYPSAIEVAGMSGSITDLRVTVNGLNHTFASDLDLLLVGPGGRSIMLLSDAGGGSDFVDTTLTFADTGAALGSAAVIPSGIYRPTNFDHGTPDHLPAPAPPAPYATTLADFNGSNPNGLWQLFVYDDLSADGGSIVRGWSLTFNGGPAVSVTTTLNGLAFQEAIAPGWTCIPGSQQVTCGLTSITANGFAPIRLKLRAPFAQGIVTNQAAVRSTAPDPNPENNTATVSTQIVAGTPLPPSPTQGHYITPTPFRTPTPYRTLTPSPIRTPTPVPPTGAVRKTASASQVAPGTFVTYTLAVEYGGPLTTVMVRDQLPSGLIVDPSSITGGAAYDPATNQIIWNGPLGSTNASDDADQSRAVAPDAATGSRASSRPLAPSAGYVWTDSRTGGRSLPLIDLSNGLGRPLPCNAPCDDFTATGIDIAPASVEFFGEAISQWQVNTNGFIQPDNEVEFQSYNPQTLPNNYNPNNLFAGLWSDLKINSTAGGWFTGLVPVNPATPNELWMVYQWKNALHFSTTPSNINFNILARTGPRSEICAVYGPLQGSLTHALVGLENATGTLGSTYYHGAQPATVANQPAPGVTICAVPSTPVTKIITYRATSREPAVKINTVRVTLANGQGLGSASAIVTFSNNQPTSTPAQPTSTPIGSGACLQEGFETVVPAGWIALNASQPLGSTQWFQGNPNVFAAQAGPTNSYAAANFNSTTEQGTISNWLFTPQVNLRNGDVLTFYTRTVNEHYGDYPDRLQVRLSTSGASTATGTSATDVGDFATLLLDINPTLVPGGYPLDWQQFTATLSGLPADASGRIAFRYFVTDGGNMGNNSNYIGIDTVNLCSTSLPTATPLQATPTREPSRTPFQATPTRAPSGTPVQATPTTAQVTSTPDPYPTPTPDRSRTPFASPTWVNQATPTPFEPTRTATPIICAGTPNCITRTPTPVGEITRTKTPSPVALTSTPTPTGCYNTLPCATRTKTPTRTSDTTRTKTPTTCATTTPNCITRTPTPTAWDQTTRTATPTAWSEITPTPALPSGPRLFIDPRQVTVGVNQIFNVELRVDTGDAIIDTVDAYLDFDPNVVEVVGLNGAPATSIALNTTIFAGATLNRVDNAAGRIDFSASRFDGPALTGRFRAATIQLRSKAPVPETVLVLARGLARRSDLLRAGTSLNPALGNGLITIMQQQAMLRGRVLLQQRGPEGNPRWITELFRDEANERRAGITIYQPNTNTVLGRFSTTTDANGFFAVPVPNIAPGIYDVEVKGANTLSVRRLLALGENAEFGTLLVGDSTGDNVVNGADVSYQVPAFLTSANEPNFRPYADTNRDGVINGADVSALVPNFLRVGPTDGNVPPINPVPVSNTNQPRLVLDASTTQAQVGDVIALTVRANLGTQVADTIDAYLDFDPAVLEVVDSAGRQQSALTMADGMTASANLNRVDNQTGRINISASWLSAPYASGDMAVTTIRFRVKSNTPTSIGLVQNGARQSGLLRAGTMISATESAAVAINVGAAPRLYLPVIRY